MRLRCLGGLRKGPGGFGSGASAGKEALLSIKVVPCVFCAVGVSWQLSILKSTLAGRGWGLGHV